MVKDNMNRLSGNQGQRKDNMNRLSGNQGQR